MVAMSCPELEIIDRLAVGQLRGEQRTAFEMHLAVCEICRQQLSEIQSNILMAARVQEAGCCTTPAGTIAAPSAETQAISPTETGPGTSIPGYQIVREVSRGGQGVVYQAIQKSTKRKVAIKVLREGHFASPGERARFQREVEVLGQLKHPNIVTIYDSGTVGGNAYYVMDYISGLPLDEYVTNCGLRIADSKRAAGGQSAFRHSPFAVKDSLRLFAKVCDAVHAAHLKGIIHRDLKPSNIRVDDSGEPRVLDFGLAKLASDTAAGGDAAVMTMTGQFIGSLPWSSPEQAEGIPSKIDVRTDVYSLGVILYQMLTGRFPYDVAGSMREVLERISHDQPVRPSAVPVSGASGNVVKRGGRGAASIEHDVDMIVLKALAKERERRYQSAGDLGRDIENYLAGLPIEARRDSTWYFLRKTVARKRSVLAVFVLVAVLVLACISISAYYYSESHVAEQARQELGERLRLQSGQLQEVTSKLRDCRSESPSHNAQGPRSGGNP